MPKRSSSSSSSAGADGDLFTQELSGKRRVAVRRYKGALLVDIREMYEDKVTGEMKPGAKGISLSLDQFKKLEEALPGVLAAIASATGGSKSDDDEAEEKAAAGKEEEGEGEEASGKPPAAKKVKTEQ